MSFGNSTSTKELELGNNIKEVIKPSFKFNSDGIPEELKAMDQWIPWALIRKNGENESTKPSKVCVYVAGGFINLGQPTINRAMSYDKALTIYEKYPDQVAGLGWVCSKDDGIIFIDFDKMVEGDTRLQYLNKVDTWTERSQSGSGYHLFVKGTIPKALTCSDVEIYASGRFCAMTGNVHGDCMIIGNGQPLISELFEQYSKSPVSSGCSEPFELPMGLIFEGGSENSKYAGRDEFLTAYAGHLVHQHSRSNTIEMLLLGNNKYCMPPMDVATVTSIATRMWDKEAERKNAALSNLVANVAHVLDSDRFYSFDSHIVMKKEALNTRFAKDFPGGKGNIPRAATTLERHPDFMKADTFGFKPVPYGKEILPENRLYTIGNRRFANRWPGFAVVPESGDIQPWLDHLAHVIPEEEYRQHFLSWLAFMIQKPHIKCQWQVVILGIEGAGKDLLLSPISKMFGSAASLIGNKDVSGDYDDGWADTKFVVVAEARAIKGDAMEKLKLKCTSTSNDNILLNPKKEAKVTMENLWTIAIITNNPDALRCNITERRFFVVKAPVVMTEAMISIFLKWRDDDNGPAHLMQYLLNYDLSNFNHGKLPCLTTHFYDMHDMTRTASEDDIMLKMETASGLFSYDFINSNTLKDELVDSGKAITKSELQATLNSNGYVKFPKKINKNVNGKTESKSAAYFVKKDSKWLHSEVSAVWDEIDRIEKLLESASKQGGHSGKF